MRRTATIAIMFALIVSGGIAAIANANAEPKTLTSSSKTAAQTLLTPQTKTETKPAAAPKKTVASQPATTKAAEPAPDKTVTVQPGDTLIAIADANQTTYQQLFNANAAIADPNIIHPDQQLRVPKDGEQLPDRISALPAATQTAVAAAASSYAAAKPAASTVSYPAVSGNDAKAFIYARESGNNPNATNASGCYGLGQDCNGRVRAQCGADYACQDEYFTNYATGRYGSWDGAYAFWQTHGWW